MKSGWPQNQAAITTNSIIGSGSTAKARASFLPICRALPVNKGGARWYSRVNDNQLGTELACFAVCGLSRKLNIRQSVGDRAGLLRSLRSVPQIEHPTISWGQSWPASQSAVCPAK